MLNEINIAIIGENSLVSRVFQVGGVESIQNEELITNGQSQIIVNGQGQYISTGRHPKVIINGRGQAIGNGSNKHITAY